MALPQWIGAMLNANALAVYKDRSAHTRCWIVRCPLDHRLGCYQLGPVDQFPGLFSTAVILFAHTASHRIEWRTTSSVLGSQFVPIKVTIRADAIANSNIKASGTFSVLRYDSNFEI